MGEFNGFFGIFLDFFERLVVFNAIFKTIAEASLFANVDPVRFAQFGDTRKGGFAGGGEVIIPNSSDGEVVVIPEFAFIFGAIGGDGGVARIDRVGFAVFVEEIGEADFVEDVI